MAEALVLLILLPFAASLLCLLARFLRRLLLAQIVAAVSFAGILLVLALLVPAVRGRAVLSYAMGGWAEPLGIALYLDGLAWIASVMGTVVGLCALLFAFGEHRYNSDFYFFFLMLLAGMEGVILTGDLFNMFVFIEIVSISSYLLIAYSLDPANLWASLRYLLLSSLSIAVFLLGLFLVYRAAGTFSLRLIEASLSSGGGIVSGAASASASGSAKALGLAAAALTVGVGLKAAFVPLHTWLPDAHAAAPHPVSALLSGVMIKISFLAVWRILSAFSSTGIQALFRWLGPLTALLAVVLALSQTDSKRLLAFHSVSQMGLITAAFGAAAGGGSAGLIASLAHVLSHSLFKSLLFLSVGAAIHLTGERDLQRSGNSSPPPWLMIFFLVGALSISGLPPTGGYVSKTLVVSLFKTSPLLSAALRLTAVGTAASMLKLSGMFRRSRTASPPAAAAVTTTGTVAAAAEPGRPALSPFCLIALTLLALLCLAGGVAPRFLMQSLVVAAVGNPTDRFPSVYTARHLIESGIYAALAVGLYLLARTRRASRVLKGIRELRLSLDGALLLVVAAVIVFAVLGSILGGVPGESFYPPLFSLSSLFSR
jgi:formate hydrogenlyase subunit 3/multisubunit Na+/H+ antiporter MnhD subunit